MILVGFLNNRGVCVFEGEGGRGREGYCDRMAVDILLLKLAVHEQVVSYVTSVIRGMVQYSTESRKQ